VGGIGEDGRRKSDRGSGGRGSHTSSNGSRSRCIVLAEGNFLDRHVLNSIGVRLQLIDIQHEDIALDLIGVSVSFRRQ